MIDRTTSLFALPGFRVLNVTLEPDGGRLVLVESVATDGGCPSCGVMCSRSKERPICRLKDLPPGSVPLRLWVCKRRFVCTEQLCSRGSFAEVTDQVPARSRLTTRLRAKVSAAVTATSLIARFVAVTAALTLALSRVVSRDRAGTWSVTSANDPREHNCSVHTKRRLQTHSRSGTLPCGRSFNRQIGRSLIREDITPHDGQPPSVATLSTSTSRPPSGSSVTFRTRNPGSANSNVVRSIMARGSLQLTALGTNSISRPRASNLGAAPLKYQEPSMYPQPPPAEVRAAHSPA